MQAAGHTGSAGMVGYRSSTSMIVSLDGRAPIAFLDNPFPNGFNLPTANALGSSTFLGLGIGEGVFIDYRSPYMQQWNTNVQRELPGKILFEAAYIGSKGTRLLAGESGITLSQLPESFMSLGTQLQDQVPNPFFRVPGTGEFGTRTTIAAGQLLRPFPQFGDINQYETTAGSHRQYNALSFELNRRTGGESHWGGRLSYTYSKTKDNQFAESNTYSVRTATPQNNYDLEAEYATSIYDSPHRIILAPIVNLPGPANRKGLAYLAAGGWTASAIVELVSGGPLNAVMSGGTSDTALGLLGGRQRPNLTGDPNTTGNDADRVASALHPDARFFSSAAFTSPGLGQYGNAPRTIDSARYQFRKNVDLVVSKEVRFAGSQAGEVRFEILNLTNTAKFGNLPTVNAVDLTSFGRVDVQAGFMRIWQLSFRYRF